MVTLDLDERQAEYLKDILDWWIEATALATPEIEVDPTINSWDELMQAANGIRASYDDAVELRTQIWSKLSDDST